jgi:hypothetical protein
MEHQMKNKYFTPDIEDFCIGYEYETIYLKSVWTKESLRIMDASWFFESYENDAVPTEFRVPYLTKEQIEAEGWKQEKSYFRKNNLYLFFENNDLEIEFGEPFTWDASDSDVRYKGECKDINTFRKIIKLLGI